MADGGLVSYGIDNHDLWQKAAGYVDRILKGAKPAELPVQEPTKFELMINLKAAKALDLTVPPSLLSARRRSDRVITVCPLLAQSGHAWCTAHVRFWG